MAVEIRLPGLGESIAEGTVVTWLKAEGDVVARDEDLVVVSTDKVETELPSPSAGTLLKIVAAEGDTVDVGAVIAVLGDPGEKIPDLPKQAAPAATARPLPTAAAPPPPPPRSSTPPALSDPTARNAEVRRTGDPKLFVSPAVRRIAREQDVDLSALSGTGRGGRITRRDIEAFIAAGGGGTGFVAPPGGYSIGQTIPWGGFGHRTVSPFDPGTPARYEPSIHEGDTVEKLGRPQRAMAEHMAFTWWRAPHVSTLIEVDMSQVSAFRVERRRTSDARPPSFTACVAWATAVTLAEHRSFNSSLATGYRRVVHRDVNLGVAVARPDGGLVVPVIRGADRMTLDEFTAALGARVEAARDGKLTAADLRGGTFTITNVGSNGNLASMPLINQPQVAISAIGAIQKRVVVTTDHQGRDVMAIRPMMYLTLTYDHRANDGAASGRFLRQLRKRLEQFEPA